MGVEMIDAGQHPQSRLGLPARGVFPDLGGRREPRPATASEIPEPRTRIPRAAHARALLHEPEIDPPFVAMLREALPDEEARRADLQRRVGSTRT